MPWEVPMFPLNSVLFPGAAVPLRLFEDRYLRMAEHLLSIGNERDRVFGSTAIRDGYEVGSHGSRSVYKIGCLVQVGEIEQQHDGTYELLGICRERIELKELSLEEPFPRGRIVSRPEATEGVSEELVESARSTFAAFRAALASIASDPYEGSLPSDPEMLSWTLSACSPLPMADRQELLEAEDAEERLGLVITKLRHELKAMNVLPSLPAVELSRTGWSPN